MTLPIAETSSPFFTGCSAMHGAQKSHPDMRCKSKVDWCALRRSQPVIVAVSEEARSDVAHMSFGRDRCVRERKVRPFVSQIVPPTTMHGAQNHIRVCDAKAKSIRALQPFVVALSDVAHVVRRRKAQRGALIRGMDAPLDSWVFLEKRLVSG